MRDIRLKSRVVKNQVMVTLRVARSPEDDVLLFKLLVYRSGQRNLQSVNNFHIARQALF